MRISDWISDVCSSDLAFIAAPLVWYGFRPVDRQNTSLANGGTAAIGMTAPEARRTRQYWMLSVMALAMALGIAGIVVHLPPLFQDLGDDPIAAARTASLVGLSSVLDRKSTRLNSSQ